MIRVDALTGFAEPNRPVFSRDRAIALARRILDISGNRALGVQMVHLARVQIKLANGRVLNSERGDEVRITLRSEIRSAIELSIQTNELTDSALRTAINRATRLAPIPPRRHDVPPVVDRSVMDPYLYGPQQFHPVSLWHEPTVSAMSASGAEAVAALVEQVKDASLQCTASASIFTRAGCFYYRHGLTAFSEETDAEVSITARTPDGFASGWSGQANRDWSRITLTPMADRAVALARQSKNPVAVEPGRRTVILSPTAVGQLLQWTSMQFEGFWTRRYHTVFSNGVYGSGGKKTKIGLRVVDPRISMVSDPADPLGGFPPYYEEHGVESGLLGFPVQPVTWIDRGILTTLAYRVQDAIGGQLPLCDLPMSLRLSPAPGTSVATVDDMIANCSEGIYINRLAQVGRLLPDGTGMMTGVTRDGCFLVKNGKIVKPVKNFRFLDSPIQAFNRLEMIGAAERIALGRENVPANNWLRWPYLPIIAPPMMLRDFNLCSLSDAV